jgi:hypothetical protein
VVPRHHLAPIDYLTSLLYCFPFLCISLLCLQALGLWFFLTVGPIPCMRKTHGWGGLLVVYFFGHICVVL